MNEITQISPPVLLAIALNGLGWCLKQSPIKNWLIPIILPAVGAAVYPFIYNLDGVSIAMKALYGWGIGWTAVGANQFLRQVTDGKSQDSAQPNPPLQQPQK